MTAAIGILAGIGFYFPLIVTTVLSLGTLSVFRWIENAVPSEFYAQLRIKFRHDNPMPQEELVTFIASHGFSIANLSYHYSLSEESSNTVRSFVPASAVKFSSCQKLFAGTRTCRNSASARREIDRVRHSHHVCHWRCHLDARRLGRFRACAS
jgi:uncharacterized membrane protein YhiD involved in acid resistance